MPTTKTFDIHTAPMRQSLYEAIIDQPTATMYLRDGTKLINGLASVTRESFLAHREKACAKIDECRDRKQGCHPDTRIARIAYANIGNAYDAISEYVIIMRYLGLDWKS